MAEITLTVERTIIEQIKIQVENEEDYQDKFDDYKSCQESPRPVENDQNVKVETLDVTVKLHSVMNDEGEYLYL
jgi:hypothetical protein